MNTKKFFVGTFTGGIAFFLLGFLIYGMALAGFYSQHAMNVSGAMKSMNDLVWWAMILGNLAIGALLTYVFLKLGTIGSFGSGAGTGAAIGFFVTLSRDMIRFATENSYDMTATIVDVLVGVVMFAVAGGVIGAVIGRGKIIK
jgi:uncharacterized membrane protein